ncbi:unnamed protein product [Mytilus edulis]|uniref:Uncharacterized protein n=1 Tax=Mytilus edulis TaxID=6550 RepID=A0A8S3R995_MYTED|nr:unnamed protein product [Mytilus edulis]
MKKSVTLTYRLVLIVILVFEHPAAVALTVDGVSYKNHVENDQAYTPENCSDWEEFDGIECVCASTTDGCGDASACNTLRLTGGKQYPKGITLAKFRRQGPDAGLTTRYKSINDNDLEIFFVAKLNAWAIGKSNTNGSFVSMVQPSNVTFPGDGIPGMLIPNKMELILHGNSTNLFACNVKKILVRIWGAKEFESVVDKIHDQIQTIQEKIIEIPDLHTTLNISLSSMVQAYRSIGHDFPQLTNLLSKYDEWLSSALKAAGDDISLLPLNILMEMPALIAASASSIALAMSGIGAVFHLHLAFSM